MEKITKISKVKKVDKRSSSNCVRGVALNLTLSQSTWESSEQVIQVLVDHEGSNLHEFACVRESHTQMAKGIHYHVYLRWTKEREISLRHFDYLGQGVHVEKTKNRECLLAYMTKEEQPVANFDFWSDLLQKRSTFPRTLTRMVVNYGFDLAEIQCRYREQLADKPWKTVSGFVNEVKATSRQLARVYEPLRFIDQAMVSQRLTEEQRRLFESNPNYQKLVDAVNGLKLFGSAHPHKSCCVALVGQPSIGKTSVLKALSKAYRAYRFPVDGWHAKSYQDSSYPVWIWDEWSLGIFPFEELLLLTEGEPVDLRIKGSKTQKEDRPMLFLSSNERIKTKVQRYYSRSLLGNFELIDLRTRALQARIQELDFGAQSIFWLSNLFVAETEDTCPVANPPSIKVI